MDCGLAMFNIFKRIAFALAFLGLLFGVKFSSIAISEVNVGKNGLAYEISPGSSVSMIAHDLKVLGVIDYPKVFEILAKLKGVTKRMQAGEYQISSKMTLDTLLNLFVSGNVKQHSFTIVEGTTFEQMIANMKKAYKLKNTVLDKKPAEIMEAIGYPGVHPEGRFLPETYFYISGDTDLDLLKRANSRLNQKLNSYWNTKNVKLPYETADDALVLASIVQKESGKLSEYSAISGVYVRRLRKNMRLQADPTVIYGFKLKKDAPIVKYLRKQNPYNTYRNKGLPPTPIAMPGEKALEAAFFPNESQALYFVADGKGGHYFSNTLEQHRRAIKQYIKNKGL